MVLHDPVEHGVGHGGIANPFVPVLNGQLRGDHSGFAAGPVIDDFQQVAAGVGITALPITSMPDTTPEHPLVNYVPFEKPVPDRRVVLAWRKSFPRTAAVLALAEAVYACGLKNVKMLNHVTAKD